MNPEFALVLGCLALGLTISGAIGLALNEPLRRLERLASSTRARRNLGPKSTSNGIGIQYVAKLVLEFEKFWETGEPSLDEYWQRPGSPRSFSLLAMLIEVDLRNRFLRGQRPSIDQYFKRYPKLTRTPDRVVSLVSQEYRLLEKSGEKIDIAKFSERYQPWRDLIISRLKDDLGNRQDSMRPAGVSD
jgi:hypothetical protein